MHMRPTAVHAVSLAVLLGIAALAILRPPRLPSEIREQLDTQFPGWRPARLNDLDRQQLRSGQHAAHLRGDFDGDGRRDWVLQITHPGEKSRHQSVLVFLARPEGRPPYVVQTVPENAGTYIGRRPAGADRDVVEDTAVVSRSDVLEILFGQEAGIAFLYRDGEFVSYTTGD